MSDAREGTAHAKTDPMGAPVSYISGVGKFVPPRVVTNAHFASYLETSDEWIQERTGIAERRWADPEMRMSDLAFPAAQEAIANAGFSASDIDGIVVATVTPDFTFPSTACVLQDRLGIKNALAFDVNAVCSGFLYALVTADGLIRSGVCKNILVVGADMFSRLVDPNDRTTCILFGDGAGAIVLSRLPGTTDGKSGILGSELHADGRQGELLKVPSGTACPPTPESLRDGKHFVYMNGREIFKLAVRGLVEVSESVATRCGISVAEIDHFISHQANARILGAVARQLGLKEEQVPMNVHKYGNTSAASVPLLLAECVESGRIKPGDYVMLSAFGAGLTWGAALVRWR